VLVKDAVYEPLRKLQTAKKFKKVKNGKLLPVGEHEFGPDIIEGNLMSISTENIEIPIITVQDL